MSSQVAQARHCRRLRRRHAVAARHLLPAILRVRSGSRVHRRHFPPPSLYLRVGLKAYGSRVTTYLVSELAERVGLPPSTLRFYEQAGLLPARRSGAGYRLFDERSVQRVGVIAAGKRLGLPLEEIGELLSVWEDGQCRDVRKRLRPMVANRIRDSERRAAEAREFTERLRRASSVLDGPAPPGRCGPGCGIGPDQEAVAVVQALPLPATRRDTEPGPPAACTMPPADLAGRIGEWGRVLSQARRREEAGDVLTFLIAPELAGEVAELAAAELRCCAFFEFTLHLVAGELRLEVRAPAGARPLLSDLFGTCRTAC